MFSLENEYRTRVVIELLGQRSPNRSSPVQRSARFAIEYSLAVKAANTAEYVRIETLRPINAEQM